MKSSQGTSNNWHELHAVDAARLLQVDAARGLTAEDARRRLDTFGRNAVSVRRGRHGVLRFLIQFHQPLIYVLIVAGAVTALLREWVDCAVIFAVVLGNAIVGFI